MCSNHWIVAFYRTGTLAYLPGGITRPTNDSELQFICTIGAHRSIYSGHENVRLMLQLLWVGYDHGYSTFTQIFRLNVTFSDIHMIQGDYHDIYRVDHSFMTHISPLMYSSLFVTVDLASSRSCFTNTGPISL